MPTWTLAAGWQAARLPHLLLRRQFNRLSIRHTMLDNLSPLPLHTRQFCPTSDAQLGCSPEPSLSMLSNRARRSASEAPAAPVLEAALAPSLLAGAAVPAGAFLPALLLSGELLPPLQVLLGPGLLVLLAPGLELLLLLLHSNPCSNAALLRVLICTRPCNTCAYNTSFQSSSM